MKKTNKKENVSLIKVTILAVVITLSIFMLYLSVITAMGQEANRTFSDNLYSKSNYVDTDVYLEVVYIRDEYNRAGRTRSLILKDSNFTFELPVISLKDNNENYKKIKDYSIGEVLNLDCRIFTDKTTGEELYREYKLKERTTFISESNLSKNNN